MDPEVSWQCAPEQPHPVPQSNLSHSQPYLSQHFPLQTCRMAGSLHLLLSFFQRSHLKLCQVSTFSSVVFNFSFLSVLTNVFILVRQQISAVQRWSQSCGWTVLTSALVRAVQQVTVTFMNWAGIGLLRQLLLFSAKRKEAEKRGAKS